MELFVIEKIKDRMRIVDPEFNDEIGELAESALRDLNIAGVDGTLALVTDSLVFQAVVTYCRMHFGTPDDYDRLKASYDEQKAQLQIASGYTTWSS